MCTRIFHKNIALSIILTCVLLSSLVVEGAKKYVEESTTVQDGLTISSPKSAQGLVLHSGEFDGVSLIKNQTDQPVILEIYYNVENRSKAIAVTIPAAHYITVDPHQSSFSVGRVYLTNVAPKKLLFAEPEIGFREHNNPIHYIIIKRDPYERKDIVLADTHGMISLNLNAVAE